MIAARFMCFAACLYLAAKKTFGVEIDPVAVADHLGVVLPLGYDSSELRERGLKKIRFDENARLWGINPVASEINAILKEHSLLECRFESISTFQDWQFEERLVELTGSDCFPVACFEYNSLFGEQVPNEQGHCVTVYRIWRVNGHSIVEIDDPGPDRAGVKQVDCEALYYACRKRRGGIWSLVPRSE
jgi:hypothetical protein